MRSRSRLLPVLLAAASGCPAAGGGPADAGCDPADCALRCGEAGYGIGTCTGEICRCLDSPDADAGVPDADGAAAEADDGGGDEAEAETEAEAGPGDVASCEGFDLGAVPGPYAGTFEGVIHVLGSDEPMEGDVSFAMEEFAPGTWSFDGTMDGTAMGGSYLWSSRVQGTADCSRLAGTFYDGVVTVEGMEFHFGGTMESSFVPYGCPDGTFEGTCTDCPLPITGDGTWNVSHL